MQEQFEAIYQTYKAELAKPLHITDRITIWSQAKATLAHPDRFVTNAVEQYLNDRALDNLAPSIAYAHTMKICWRAAKMIG